MSNGPAASPAFHRLTNDDRGPIIIITAIAWIFVTLIFASIRFGLAWRQRLHLVLDDWAFALSVIFSTASSICFHIAVSNGLGKRMRDVPQHDLPAMFQALYAGEILSIAAMASAKTSTAYLSDRVARRNRHVFNAMLGLIAFWALFSIFATAFHGGLPEPWMFHAEDRHYICYPVIGLNILTDALLATWILSTLSRLLMDSGKRATAMVLFASRLIVCAFAVAQLHSLVINVHNPDVTYAIFSQTLWGICVNHTSVILSTVPRTNRFIVALQSMHVSTRLTDFELANPNASQGAPPEKGFSTPDTTTTEPTVPRDAHLCSPNRSPVPTIQSRVRTASRSPARSHRSQRPLVEESLHLTPSVEQGFTAHITSQSQTSTLTDEKRGRGLKQESRREWARYLSQSGKRDQRRPTANRFPWTSAAGTTQERIMQTREVTQEVEVVPPKEPRWAKSKSRRTSKE